MKKLGKSYEIHTYEGAATGFMGAQAGAGGARTSRLRTESWPLVVKFFTQNLK
jgi:hypothetical protein